MRVMAYNAQRLVEKQIDSLDQLADLLHQTSVTWLNVDGLGDAEIIR